MNPPQVIIELSEYNRLLELDKANKDGLPQSIAEFRRLLYQIAGRLDSQGSAVSFSTPHIIAKEFRRLASHDEELKSMLNEKT